LVYQEGRFEVKAQTRIRGMLLGAEGPDFVVGRATTMGIQQTQLSKDLQPPAKWSYRKLVGWFALCSLVALIACVQWVMSGSAPISSLPVPIYLAVSFSLFFFLVGLFWRHNRAVYPRKYAEWDRSFLCMRCGCVRRQPIEGAES
jgi:hypothetical protein